MQIPSRFTIGVHTLLVIAIEGEQQKVTSEVIANSVGVNPVIIRKILSQLKKATMITVARGFGGAKLLKEASAITLLDVYLATDSQGENGMLFGFHTKISPDCPIGNSVHHVLDDRLLAAQRGLEDQLEQMTLQDLVNDARKIIKSTSAI